MLIFYVLTPTLSCITVHLNGTVTWYTVVFIGNLGLYFKCWTEGVIVKE